jgi:AcrR family transcriptional regulator
VVEAVDGRPPACFVSGVFAERASAHVRKLAVGCTFCYRIHMQGPTSLRERKKAETRAALSQAVLRLALERGLDAVTADDIAAAANVSVRTFHNYFGTKEEALVAAWKSEFRVYVDALRDRPSDEPILASLEHVFSRIASSVADGGDGIAVHSDLLWTSLAMARYRSALLDEGIRMITDIVAARTGTDAATDVYPHMLTAAAISAIVTSFQFPGIGATTSLERQRLLHECFNLLRAGFERPAGVVP